MNSPVVKVIDKLYNTYVISNHNRKEGNLDSYYIVVVVTFSPKEKTSITPELVIVSGKYKLTEPDSSGERALFKISDTIWAYVDDNMPILSYVNLREEFKVYCNFLFEEESKKVSDKIDPDWNKYGSY